MPELIVNIIIICLLIPTIVFAYLLNKKLELLRNSRHDLGKLIEAFNDATIRAESGIPKLKQAADSAGGHLKEEIEKAQILRDDLAFLIERAESSATKLEHTIRQGRNENAATKKTPAKKEPTAERQEASKDVLYDDKHDDFMVDEETDRTKAEEELLKALKALK